MRDSLAARGMLGLAFGLVIGAVLSGCGQPSAESGSSSLSSQQAVSIVQPWSSPAEPAPALFPVRQDGKWGFIDRTGKVVIDFKYDAARAFSDGMAAVKVDGDTGYIDEQGVEIILPASATVQVLDYFSEGLASSHVGTDPRGYMDKTGQLVIEADPEWSDISCFSEGLAGVCLADGGAGYINRAGQLVINLPRASTTFPFSEGLAAVEEPEGWGYIDGSGHFVIKPEWSYATEFSDGLAVVEYDFMKYGIIDTTGRLLKKLDYDQVLGFGEGLAPALVGGFVSTLEKGGNPLGGETEGAWGYIDESGTLVIPLTFKYADVFAGGLARVDDQDGKMAYINHTGNYVWREK